MSARVHGSTVLGLVIGLTFGALLLLPLYLSLRDPMGWDDSAPDVLFLGAGLVFLAWVGYLGARFGHQVALHDQETRRQAPGELGSWSGEGWSLRMTEDEIHVQVGEQRHVYRGMKRSYLTCRRQGAAWMLETPDGVKELPGMDETQARAVQKQLLDLPFDD